MLQVIMASSVQITEWNHEQSEAHYSDYSDDNDTDACRNEKRNAGEILAQTNPDKNAEVALVERTADYASTSRSRAPSCVHDFSFNAASIEPGWPSFDTVLPQKVFRTIRKEGNQATSTFPVNKKDLETLLDRLSNKYEFDKKRIAFEYALINNGVQDKDTITIDRSCGLDELKTFYCQAANMDRLVVFEKPKERGKRWKKGPCEVASCNLKRSIKSGLDRSFYETLLHEFSISNIYNKKRVYVQFLLGSGEEGCNMLNPLNAICHVKNCMQILSLKATNNISTLIEHWKSHMNENMTSYHKSCEVAVRRHVFLRTKNGDPWKQVHFTIDEMEEMQDSAGDPLSIQPLIGGNCFIAKNGKKFRGHSLMVNLTVLGSILDGDVHALDGLPKVRKIGDCFSRSQQQQQQQQQQRQQQEQGEGGSKSITIEDEDEVSDLDELENQD